MVLLKYNTKYEKIKEIIIQNISILSYYIKELKSLKLGHFKKEVTYS